MSAEHQAPRTPACERSERTAQAVAIARRPRRRWRSLGPRLTEGQVDPKRRDPARGERARHGAQHRRLAIGAGAVRENDAIARRKARPVKDAAHGALAVTLFEGLDVANDNRA